MNFVVAKFFISDFNGYLFLNYLYNNSRCLSVCLSVWEPISAKMVGRETLPT